MALFGKPARGSLFNSAIHRRRNRLGISAFIDPYGNIINQTKWDEEAVIVAEIPIVSNTTFYVKYGDYIGRLASFLSVFFIFFVIANKKRN